MKEYEIFYTVTERVKSTKKIIVYGDTKEGAIIDFINDFENLDSSNVVFIEDEYIDTLDDCKIIDIQEYNG